VGLFVNDQELRAGLELVKSARSDLIVLTGDLVDHDVRYADKLARFVRQLETVSKHGVFAIPGNHDYYAGASEVMQALREAGAEVLLNRHVRIGDTSKSFVLAGVDEISAPGYGGVGPDLGQAFRDAPPELARVLLSHNPSFYPTASSAADLVLSGHTHGGQITLFINPAELVLRHGYVRGHYWHGASQIYVNRGFGTAGPPARVGSPPEVTRIILTSAA
jgi:predicted MPP superfamily phosphohydrolase